MKRLKAWLRGFFFPSSQAALWIKLLPYAFLGVLTLVLLTGAAYAWEYTNSPAFCGTSCHTMPPEYTAYLVSPHARIACVDCHIGKGFIATRITRKAGDVKHIFATMFHTYEFPIRAGEMRPARETCELCHFPEKFSDDSLRVISRFSEDKASTPYSIYLTVKTGGGNERQGLGKGIHWHILNNVYYLPSDEEEQKIPYVKIIHMDGNIEEFIDVDTTLDVSTIDATELKEMDCITCHNRITHLVATPEDTIDRLIARGLISRTIPEVRKKALEVYSQIFETTEMGLNNIAGLESYYRQVYPEFYTVNNQLVQEAITVLQEAYADSVFPEQNSDWNSHPNNIGHKDSPGCFRCHDGKHINANQEAIRLECNLCHSIPAVAGPYDFVTRIEISRGPEPEAHKNPNWITLHNQVMDTTCTNCHDTSDPGGISNTSFCSNSACHGNVWTYAGFDAPKLRELLQSQRPPTPVPGPLPAGGPLTYSATIGPLLQARCASCHGEAGLKGLNMTTYQALMIGSQSGSVIIPGNAVFSLLVQKQSEQQPHFGQFSPEELKLIINWINAGAPE